MIWSFESFGDLRGVQGGFPPAFAHFGQVQVRKNGPVRASPDPSIRAARYSGQVYRSSYDLCLYVERLVRNLSWVHIYSLGPDLRDGARRTVRLIGRANARC